MPKLQKNKTSYYLYLPAPIIRAMGWQVGDEIEVKIGRRGCLELVRR